MILMLPEAEFSFSKSSDRFHNPLLRHLFEQRRTSGRFQAEDFLNIRSSPNCLKAVFLQQFANMRSGFRCKGIFNVRFFSFNIRFLGLNVHLFRCLKDAGDMQCTVMKRMVFIYTSVLFLVTVAPANVRFARCFYVELPSTSRHFSGPEGQPSRHAASGETCPPAAL